MGIIAGFNNLRQEQRSIATKTNELQQDLNEHNIVIETLNGVDGDRKCFRMVGGVLVERTVKEVVPALVNNRDKMTGHFKYHKVYEKNAQLVTHVIPTDGQTDRKPGE